jgi:hypothetical protein
MSLHCVAQFGKTARIGKAVKDVMKTVDQVDDALKVVKGAGFLDKAVSGGRPCLPLPRSVHVPPRTSPSMRVGSARGSLLALAVSLRTG